jgi:hypothetical protein
MTMKSILILFAIFTALPAHALEFYRADLQAIEGKGSSASGIASLALDEEAGELTYEISVSGLGSAEIAAHIHAADGTILHQLPLGSPKNGVWSGLGIAQIFQLRSGSLFILVHTEDNPGGEVRGDIVAGRVSTEPGSVGRIKARFSGD